MVMQNTHSDASFSSMLQQLFSSQADDVFKGLREKAWEHFLELGLPQRTSEAFQYVSLRQLYETRLIHLSDVNIDPREIDLFIYPECRDSFLVFVNGTFRPGLSSTTALPSSIVIFPLDEAMRTYGSFLQHRLGKNLREENDPFAVLNLAMHQRGAFVYVPPKVQAEVPLQILHIMTKGAEIPFFAMPRLHLFVGAHASLKAIAKTVSAEGACYFGNGFIDAALEEGAGLEFARALDSAPSSWRFETIRATLKRGSRFKSVAVATQAKVARQDYRIVLLGENAEAELKGLSMLNGTHQAHTHVLMKHEAPHCQSMQHFKSILDDASQSSFEGKIFVDSAAQKTQAYQLNNHLILGDRASANSKPNLEIFADDVKASHGATVAQLDEQQLFYLAARGLCPKEAKTLLILGFCREILDQVPYASLQEELIQFAESFLSQGEKAHANGI